MTSYVAALMRKSGEAITLLLLYEVILKVRSTGGGNVPFL